MRWTGSLAIAVLVVLTQLGSVAHAQPCTVPLVASGPVDPANGFPLYYLDSNNLGLAPCLDFVCDPALPVPNPNLPISFPDNFPDEFFYQRAIANMTGPGGQTFLLNLALEGSFLNGVPVNGDQMVFTRLRVRATGLTPGAVYTVTHPFGVETLRADGVPPVVINFTRDTGNIPLAFTVALNGDVGPFLSFLAGASPPPPGTIGNPAANQTVTGSACGTNIFRVEGPGLPAGGVQTNLFGTLIGRRAVICGNGFLDPGEQCDLGSANGAPGGCCTANCTFAAAGTPCSDGNPCNVNGTCDGTSTVCPVTGFTTAPCNDANACTTADTCANGTCVGGPPPNCDDGNVCTTDTCDPVAGCVHTNNTAACDDGNACTGPDACGGGACQPGPAINCDDGNSCTTDGCDPATGCVHTNNNSLTCTDNNACTSLDFCLNGQCLGGPSISCDDGNPCTDDLCDAQLGCLHVNNHAACSDGNACTTNDTCSNGTCVGGPPPNCDDGNICTADTCVPATGCLHQNVSVACDDGNACTTNDHCSSGVCLGGAPRNCDDGNPCTTDSCSPTAGCQNVNADGASCDDGNACTVNDTCRAGSCVGVAGSVAVCPPLDSCHLAGTCDPLTGTCSNPPKPNGSACDDGNACTQADTCRLGVCKGGAPVACTALDSCHTAGVCDPRTGACSNPPKADGAPCNDGLFCTVNDTCTSGVCGGAPRNCATAADQCNNAVCNEAADRCDPVPKADGTSCNDGNACTRTDSCRAGTCIGTSPVVCVAADDCHNAGVCQPSTGTCTQPVKPIGTPCNDGNTCTQNDTCNRGVCSGTSVVCAASDQCHAAGTCDPATGACSNPAKPDGTTCSDGNACTQTDTCRAGACVGAQPVVCSAADQCHAAGTCDPATGTCSSPARPNGTPCDDGSACTRPDTCQAGVCTGANAGACAAPDQCHTAGTCDPATGTCTNPAKPDGTACNDGNPCTQTDTCQSGTCVGTKPVVCAASDQCHTAGVCDPATGTCSSPPKPDGTACDDGNACTLTDTCQTGVCRGVNPVVCAVLDQCHAVGTCNPATGACSNPEKPNGAACDDGSACTRSDSCQAGVCRGRDPVVCTAADQCHDAGTCDPGTGACSTPPKPDGAACDDGNACTQADTCHRGVCTGGDPVACTAADQCHVAGTCDPTTGRCTEPAKPDGTHCDDGNACTRTDTCQAGVCSGTSAVTCSPSDACHDAGTCDPATGLCSNPNKPDGSVCNDGNGCTRTDTCQGGSCVGSNPVACLASDPCHTAGICDPATGTCSDPPKQNGASCDDGNPCTRTDSCQSGTCTGTNPVVCSAADACHDAGTCNPSTGACTSPPKPDGTSCDDGSACTRSDTCQGGTCTGANPVSCPAPDECHQAGVCDPVTGTCSFAAKPDGSACNDGDACTQSDTCQAGVCRGGNPVVCAASDQCHLAGTCDPATGTCPNPPKDDGSPCNDANACTRSDVCEAGVCRGTDPVVCAPSDQCHAAGTCNTLTGTCTNPAKADGTACDDGAFCTASDSCTAGVCGGTPRDCGAAGDQCNDGVCNEAAQRCEPAPVHDGTPCSDGNLCTQTDTCHAGVCVGLPIVCTARDQCHGIGVCDPTTGSCTNPVADGGACDDGQFCTVGDTCLRGVCRGTPRDCSALLDACNGAVCNEAAAQCERAPKRDGTPCDDADACTQTDTCRDGTCVGSAPVACAPTDQCHDAGTCDPHTGACSNPPKADGSACTDGDECTRVDTCESGSCVGGDPIVCIALDPCHQAGSCDPASGACSTPPAPDGTPCEDGSRCSLNDACVAGTCVAGAPADCDDGNPCTEDSCDPSGGCQHRPLADGTGCDDGNACTATDVCGAGVCIGSSPVVCTALDQCHEVGVCDPATGTCSQPPRSDASPCNDGDACTRDDVCRAGVCVPGAATVCGALDQCHAPGVCDPATGTCSNPEIGCDDGDPCTVDACFPDSGCAHLPTTGFASITCVFAANRELGVCPGESVPAALTRLSGEAQQMIAEATAASGRRHAKILLRKAARKLGAAARLATRSGKKRQLSVACVGALRGLYLDGKARAETLARGISASR